jgi:hypothetical protein
MMIASDLNATVTTYRRNIVYPGTYHLFDHPISQAIINFELSIYSAPTTLVFVLVALFATAIILWFRGSWKKGSLVPAKRQLHPSLSKYPPGMEIDRVLKKWQGGGIEAPLGRTQGSRRNAWLGVEM